MRVFTRGRFYLQEAVEARGGPLGHGGSGAPRPFHHRLGVVCAHTTPILERGRRRPPRQRRCRVFGTAVAVAFADGEVGEQGPVEGEGLHGLPLVVRVEALQAEG